MCPLYEYRCPEAHLTEIVRSMKDQIPKTVKCRSCPARAVRIFSAPAVQDDFPEHFNISMGCVVKNRKHHEQIQKERGLQDWTPVKGSPMIDKLRKEGHRI